MSLLQLGKLLVSTESHLRVNLNIFKQWQLFWKWKIVMQTIRIISACFRECLLFYSILGLIFPSYAITVCIQLFAQNASAQTHTQYTFIYFHIYSTNHDITTHSTSHLFSYIVIVWCNILLVLLFCLHNICIKKSGLVDLTDKKNKRKTKIWLFLIVFIYEKSNKKLHPTQLNFAYE